MDINQNNMEWINGKPGGTIFQRKSGGNANAYNVVFNNVEPKVTKYFSFKTYDGAENAYSEAKKFQVQKSNELGLTRNMYRKLPDDIYWNDDPKNFPVTKNTYEVHVVNNSDDYYMLIDECDLPTVDSLTICIVRSGKVNAQPYASFSHKGTREEKKNKDIKWLQNVHNKITGFAMVDHINRNTLDNRRCNLRETNHKENMNNRGNVHKGASGILGIRYVKKDNAWQARIKQDGKEYTQSFSIKKYGDDGAKRMALEARKLMNERFNSQNGDLKD